MTSDKSRENFTYCLGLLLSGSGVSESEFSSSEPDVAPSLSWEMKEIFMKFFYITLLISKIIIRRQLLHYFTHRLTE